MAGITRVKKRACDSCHRRKIHCDGALPKCNWCSHHNTECTFDRQSKVATRRSKKRTATDELRDRLTRVEETISRARQSLQYTGSSTPGSHTESGSPAASVDNHTPTNPSSPFGVIHFAGFNLGHISSFNGKPFFSEEGGKWIESRTGQKPSLEILCLSECPWQHGYRVDPTLLQDQVPQSSLRCTLPGRALVQSFLTQYFNSKFRLVFPVIDPVLFQGTLDLAYGDQAEPESLAPLSSKACVFGFLSMVSVLQEEWETRDGDIKINVDSKAFSLGAQYMLPQVLHERSITALQVLLLLCMNSMFFGQLHMASMYHNLACHVVFMLQGHLNPGISADDLDEGQHLDPILRAKLHLRNLFWVCYTVDKDIALRTGQPPMIHDDNCDLSLPPRYPDNFLLGWNTDPSGIANLFAPILPGELRLAIIRSKTYSALCSTKAMQKSDAQLLRDIRELDDEVEQWRLSLPLTMRPSLSVSPGMRPHPSNQLPAHLATRTIFLHFEYHCLMTTIHQTSSRCRAWTSKKSGEMSGINSSLILSLEASRSTMNYLRVTSHNFFKGAFWILIFYPVSAIVTIFCHVLMDPLDPDSKSDLELLSLAPGLLRGMRAERVNLPEGKELDLLDEFSTEIHRLASCAIAKANAELENEQDKAEGVDDA